MLMPSIIARYQGEEDVLFQINCAQSFGPFKFIYNVPYLQTEFYLF